MATRRTDEFSERKLEEGYLLDCSGPGFYTLESGVIQLEQPITSELSNAHGSVATYVTELMNSGSIQSMKRDSLPARRLEKSVLLQFLHRLMSCFVFFKELSSSAKTRLGAGELEFACKAERLSWAASL